MKAILLRSKGEKSTWYPWYGAVKIVTIIANKKGGLLHTIRFWFFFLSVRVIVWGLGLPVKWRWGVLNASFHESITWNGAGGTWPTVVWSSIQPVLFERESVRNSRKQSGINVNSCVHAGTLLAYYVRVHVHMLCEYACKLHCASRMFMHFYRLIVRLPFSNVILTAPFHLYKSTVMRTCVQYHHKP